MNIAYVSPIAGSDAPGIVSRQLALHDAWRRAGHSVALWPLPAAVGRSARSGWRNFALDLLGTAGLVAAIETSRPDIVVLRHYFPMRPLAAMARRVPTVLEIHNSDLSEFRATSAVRYAVALFGRKAYFRAMRGALCVSREAAMAREFATLGGPTAVVGNYAMVTPSDRPPDVKGICYACGNDAPWQGIDVYLELARRLPSTAFKLLMPRDLLARFKGDASSVPNLSLLAGDGAQFEAEMKSSAGALSTLALHRAGRREAPSLKTRDALALGVPVLVPHEDWQLEQLADPAVWVRPNAAEDIETLVAVVSQWIRVLPTLRVRPETISELSVDAAAQRRIRLLQDFIKPATLG